MFPACLAVVTAIYATHSADCCCNDCYARDYVAERSPILDGSTKPCEPVTVTGDLSEETFADAVIQIEDS